MRDFQLDKFQEEAIRYARSNHSVIVSAPTGAGKTLIAEYVIEDCIKNNKGVIYTAPIKALSNQKFRDFSIKYPDHAGILTGDVSINRNAPILIMTTEIFRNAIMVNPEEFEHREWVIFDEIHYLDDIERGTVWEEAIILLPPNMRMLALSATIPNMDEFTNWLKKIHKFPIKAITENYRPVPLHFFFQCNNQVFSSFKELKKTHFLKETFKNIPYRKRHLISSSTDDTQTKPNRLHTLVKYLEKRDALPCLYFSFSRRRCEELAGEMFSFDFLDSNEKKEITSLFDELVTKFGLASSHINFLYPLIKRGIAYHHAGLLPALKEIIERLFTTGLIKLIFTTETFALGINMPARTVVFDALRKFYGRFHSYLKTRDFYQMAGRAGRRGIDKEGYVISRVTTSSIDLRNLEGIIYGSYEPIRSQLNSCYATILNLYSDMGEKIYDIYPSSFHFHQAPKQEQKHTLSLLKGKISLLKDLSYIVDGDTSAKAELASKVYSFELPIGELFEKGYLENLDDESLFTIITSLVYEPRKGERKPRLSKRIKRIKKDLNRFIRNIHREERKFHIYPLSKKFYFHLSEASRMWFEGADFSRLVKSCSIDEGEIVRYFRMSLQVLREIHSSEVISESFKKRLIHCMKKVNRDVVDARKQLLQQI